MDIVQRLSWAEKVEANLNVGGWGVKLQFGITLTYKGQTTMGINKVQIKNGITLVRFHIAMG